MIIHASICDYEHIPIPVPHIGRATKAALEFAENEGFETITFGPMGVAENVKLVEAAQWMTKVLKAFPYESLEEVYLVDKDDLMINAWRAHIM